jgi:Tubulin binding cofactor C
LSKAAQTHTRQNGQSHENLLLRAVVIASPPAFSVGRREAPASPSTAIASPPRRRRARAAMPDAMDVVASEGGLWIRRQVFEHSVGSATLLASASAARIDFPRLARVLAAASVSLHPDEAPAVTYEVYVAVVREHAHLSSVEEADLIVEGLETNAPGAFVRCNEADKLAPGRQLDYRQLLIPVPELVAFMQLHAAAALGARYSESADAVWPAATAEPDSATTATAVVAAATTGAAAAAPDANSEAVSGAAATAASPSDPSQSLTDKSPTPTSQLQPLPIQELSLPEQPAFPQHFLHSPPVGARHAEAARQQHTPPIVSAAHMATATVSQLVSPGATPDSTGSPRAPATFLSALGDGPGSPTRAPTFSPPRLSVTPLTGTQSLSPLRSPREGGGGGGSSGDGALVRKKTGPHSPASSMLNSSSAIVATVTHALQRETHLVADNLQSLLATIAASYGVYVPADHDSSGGDSASGSIAVRGKGNGSSKGGAVENGDSPIIRSAVGKRPYGGVAYVGDADSSDDDDDDDSEVVDHRKQLAASAAKESAAAAAGGDAGKMDGVVQGSPTREGHSRHSSGASDTSTGKVPSAVGKLMVTRSMLENLSFLITTASSFHNETRTPISSIVPEWRDPNCHDSVPLKRIVELTTSALTTMSADPVSGPIDTTEIRDLERKTIMRRQLPATSVDPTEFPHGREVRITDCSESQVYLLCSLGRVSLIACKDVTLFVGSCVSLSLINCERVRVHAVARVCRLTNCFDSEIYVCTNRRPQIVGDCRGIMFAPYNAAYPYIRRDLAAVGVDPTRNVWNQYHRPLTSRDPTSGELTPAVVTTLPPERFSPFGVPVHPDTEDDACGAEWKSNALVDDDSAALRVLFQFELPLPPEYEAAINERRQQIDTLLRQIRTLPNELPGPGDDVKPDDAMTDLPASPEGAAGGSGNVTPPSGVSSPRRDAEPLPSLSARAQAQQAIEERFREWLISSGHTRQVNDLMKLEPGAQPVPDSAVPDP